MKMKWNYKGILFTFDTFTPATGVCLCSFLFLLVTQSPAAATPQRGEKQTKKGENVGSSFSECALGKEKTKLDDTKICSYLNFYKLYSVAAKTRC